MSKLIVIDPGHGGKDPGAVAYGLREADVVLKLAHMVRDELSSYDADVRMTRDGDFFVELNQRAALANKWGAVLFISLHCNAGGGQGFESYVYIQPSTASVSYQNTIHDEVMVYLSKYGIKDRGKKRANLAVCRETRMPAVLLENLFIDHERENALLRDETFLKGLARAIACGIAKALGLRAKEQPKPAQKPQPPQRPDVSPWAKEAVEWAKKMGLMVGFEDGTFRGTEPVTREQLAAILQRFYKLIREAKKC